MRIFLIKTKVEPMKNRYFTTRSVACLLALSSSVCVFAYDRLGQDEHQLVDKLKRNAYDLL
jgi:hypothetical protein